MGAGIDSALLASAADRLRRGLLVAFPTETVYGLGADALSPRAVQSVFEAKGRPANNPLIVHVSGIEMARRMASEWPAAAQRLAERFWPGPLTLVLARAACVPDAVTAGGPTVAVRCPDHPVALSLIGAFGGPLVGPSANPSGSISPTTAEHVRAGLGDKDVLVLDGGPCRGGLESTVLWLAGGTPRVLRSGLVSPEAIESVLGEPVGRPEGSHAGGGPAPSPGMLARHYAPLTRAVLFEAWEWPEVLDSAPGPAVVLTHERTRVADPPHLLMRLPMDAESYAGALYARLHEADAIRPSLILIERPRGTGGVWDAVRDRLARACEPVPPPTASAG